MGKTTGEKNYLCKNCGKEFEQVTLHSCGGGAEWEEL